MPCIKKEVLPGSFVSGSSDQVVLYQGVLYQVVLSQVVLYQVVLIR